MIVFFQRWWLTEFVRLGHLTTRFHQFQADYILPAAPLRAEEPYRIPPARSSGSAEVHWNRRRAAGTTEFRSEIYRRNLYVEPESVADLTGRYRETSPEWYRNNQAQTHRLVPWLNRELNVLMSTNPVQVPFVINFILVLVQRCEIHSQEFRDQLVPYVGNRASHFQHEFRHYARSTFDLVGYDRNARSVSEILAILKSQGCVSIRPIQNVHL